MLDQRAIKQLWIVNIALLIGALLTGAFGFAMLPSENKAFTGQERQKRSQQPGGASDESATGGQDSDSPLVAIAKSFAQRWVEKPPPEPPKPKVVTPPPPKVVTPPPEPEVVEPPKPKTPPPPPKPIKPPDPRFQLKATMIIGPQRIGWGRGPSDKEDRMIWPGAKIEDHYVVIDITDGAAEFEREGFTYEVKVPEPQPGQASISVDNRAAGVPAATTRPSPTRPTAPTAPESRTTPYSRNVRRR